MLATQRPVIVATVATATRPHAALFVEFSSSAAISSPYFSSIMMNQLYGLNSSIIVSPDVMKVSLTALAACSPQPYSIGILN